MEDSEQVIKLEFFDEEDHDVTAKALMTLHDSVQNMPIQQKSALQEAMQEASPIKRSRVESIESYQEYYKGSEVFLQDQKKVMDQNYICLNNTLKQSTGRRWAYFEWFYSNIDRALLLGNNDFETCLNQLFNNLKTRKLTKSQWSIIRRLMGKPRRCSPAFFEEERVLLEEKRKKIRYLHQLKGFEVTDIAQFKDLPDEIPMPMVIGTKVTAKVPFEEGLLTGTVDAVDTVNNTYRISFDREGIGSHSIPDTDVASEHYESMNLQLFIVKERPKVAGGNSPDSTCRLKDEEKELNTNMSPARLRLKEALSDESSGTYGGFPIRFLLYITSLAKAIELKQKYVNKLREMNSDFEKQQPFKETKTDFLKNYAFVVLELDKINKRMNTTFDGIQSYLQSVMPQLGLQDPSNGLKSHCDKKARELVHQSQQILRSEQAKELIVKLTSIMLQINNMSENSSKAFEMSSLDDTLREVKAGLSAENVTLFEDKVETSIAFIKNGLQENQSMLAAFSNNNRQHKRKKEIMTTDFSSDDDFDDIEELEDDDPFDDLV